jgi:hypothetical protein
LARFFVAKWAADLGGVARLFLAEGYGFSWCGEAEIDFEYFTNDLLGVVSNDCFGCRYAFGELFRGYRA